MKLIRHFLVCVAALVATTSSTISAVNPNSLRSRSDEAVPSFIRDSNEGEKNGKLADSSDDSMDDVLSALALEFKAVEVGLAVEVDTDQAHDNDVGDDINENLNDFNLLSYDRQLRGSMEEKTTLVKTPKTTAKPSTSKPATTSKTSTTPKPTKPTRTHSPSTTPTPAPTIIDPEPTDIPALTPTV